MTHSGKATRTEIQMTRYVNLDTQLWSIHPPAPTSLIARAASRETHSPLFLFAAEAPGLSEGTLAENVLVLFDHRGCRLHFCSGARSYYTLLKMNVSGAWSAVCTWWLYSMHTAVRLSSSHRGMVFSPLAPTGDLLTYSVNFSLLTMTLFSQRVHGSLVLLLFLLQWPSLLAGLCRFIELLIFRVLASGREGRVSCF